LSATKEDRFQQKAIGLLAILLGWLLLNFTGYRNL
jgi:hypothetical protein